MGLIGNLLMAGLVHRNNHRRNGISNRLFGVIPDSGNVLICGGDMTSDRSFAREIKENSFIDNVVRAVREHRPTVCIYSDDSLTPDIMAMLNDSALKDNICLFGHTYSYIPFDKNVDSHRVEEMMRKLISSYNQRNNSYGSNIQTIMTMLINILKNYFPPDYFTYTNLANIVEHLVNSSGGIEFIEWISVQANADLRFFENQITIEWDTAITEFFNFWKMMDSEVKAQQENGLIKRSLFSCLLDNKVCVFRLSSNYSMNMVELLLNELSFYRDVRVNYTLIDYNVDIRAISNYRLLDVGRSIIIGHTLDSIGMRDYNPPRPTFVSLGITAGEAMEIFNKMVATGWWTQVSMGFGHHSHSHIEFAPRHQEPIPCDALVNVRDGSAYVISPQGYTRVDIMFA